MNTQIEKQSLEPSGELAAAISNFRSAVTHIADRETARPVPADWLAPARQRRRRAQHNMILAWACAALLCFAMLPLSVDSHPAPVHQAVVPVAVQAPESDSALLEQVDTNVSQSVPSPLAPLVELENWNATSNTTSSDASVSESALTQTERTNANH
jgi:hypothetical protein